MVGTATSPRRMSGCPAIRLRVGFVVSCSGPAAVCGPGAPAGHKVSVGLSAGGCQSLGAVAVCAGASGRPRVQARIAKRKRGGICDMAGVSTGHLRSSSVAGGRYCDAATSCCVGGDAVDGAFVAGCWAGAGAVEPVPDLQPELVLEDGCCVVPDCAGVVDEDGGQFPGCCADTVGEYPGSPGRCIPGGKFVGAIVGRSFSLSVGSFS